MASADKTCKVATPVIDALLAAASPTRKADALRIAWPSYDDTITKLQRSPNAIKNVSARLATALCDNNLVTADVAATAAADTRRSVSAAGAALSKRLGVEVDTDTETRKRYDDAFSHGAHDTWGGRFAAIVDALYKRKLPITGEIATRLADGLADGTISFNPQQMSLQSVLGQSFRDLRVTSSSIAAFAAHQQTCDTIAYLANSGFIGVADMIANGFHIEPHHIVQMCNNGARSDNDIATNVEAGLDVFDQREGDRFESYSMRWATAGLSVNTRRRLVARMTTTTIILAAMQTPQLLQGALGIADTIVVNTDATSRIYLNMLGRDGANSEEARHLITTILRGNADAAGHAATGAMTDGWTQQLAALLWQDDRSITQIGMILDLMSTGEPMSFDDAEDVAMRLA